MADKDIWKYEEEEWPTRRRKKMIAQWPEEASIGRARWNISTGHQQKPLKEIEEEIKKESMKYANQKLK